MKIKNLPEEERPMEKALKTGIGRLSDAELIALIIRTGSKNESAVQVAERLISDLDNGVRGLSSALPEEIMATSGIGEAKACAVCAAAELGKRISKPALDTRYTIVCADDAAGIFMEDLRYERKEHFKSIMLDSRGKVIRVQDISVGDLNMAPVHPREVFSPAVRTSAQAVIFVHNHPSGDPAPSEDDIAATRRLYDAGELLGIRVLDHIIIGNGTYSSMAALGLMPVP